MNPYKIYFAVALVNLNSAIVFRENITVDWTFTLTLIMSNARPDFIPTISTLSIIGERTKQARHYQV